MRGHEAPNISPGSSFILEAAIVIILLIEFAFLFRGK